MMMMIDTQFVHVNGVTSVYSTCIQLTELLLSYLDCIAFIIMGEIIRKKPIPLDVYRPSGAYLTCLWLLHVYDWPTPNHPGFHILASLGEYRIEIALCYASHVAEEGSASPRPQNICPLHQFICRRAAFQRRILNHAKCDSAALGAQRNKVSRGKRAFSFRVELMTGSRTHCKPASHLSSILNLSTARSHRPDPLSQRGPQKNDDMSRKSPALCNMPSCPIQHHHVPSLAPSLSQSYLVIVESYMFELQKSSIIITIYPRPLQPPTYATLLNTQIPNLGPSVGYRRAGSSDDSRRATF